MRNAVNNCTGRPAFGARAPALCVVVDGVGQSSSVSNWPIVANPYAIGESVARTAAHDPQRTVEHRYRIGCFAPFKGHSVYESLHATRRHVLPDLVNPFIQTRSVSMRQRTANLFVDPIPARRGKVIDVADDHEETTIAIRLSGIESTDK